MQICHVNLARGFSGGERQTLQLIIEQLRLGYQLTVVAIKDSPFSEEVKKLSCKLVLTTHFLFQHKKSITMDCQLIHVHEGRAIYWALMQSVRFSIPYIVTRRIDNPLKNKWISIKAYKRASAIVGLSSAIVDAVKVRYPNANIYKIPSSPVSYPINRIQLSDIINEFADKFIVILAGNLLAHKGHYTAVEAARLLENKLPKVHFIFVGDGPEKDNLLDQASELKNITFVGKQTDMGTWFAAANLFIHPSYSEGLGSVILEALQAGLPVIGTRAGGIPDIIEDQVSGLLVDVRDEQALANAIARIVVDESLKNKLVIGGQEKLKQFEIGYTAALYQTLYKDLNPQGC